VDGRRFPGGQGACQERRRIWAGGMRSPEGWARPRMEWAVDLPGGPPQHHAAPEAQPDRDPVECTARMCILPLPRDRAQEDGQE